MIRTKIKKKNKLNLLHLKTRNYVGRKDYVGQVVHRVFLTQMLFMNTLPSGARYDSCQIELLERCGGTVYLKYTEDV